MLYIPLERAFKALLESVLTFDPKFQVWDINFENFYRSIGKIFSSKIEEIFLLLNTKNKDTDIEENFFFQNRRKFLSNCNDKIKVKYFLPK